MTISEIAEGEGSEEEELSPPLINSESSSFRPRRIALFVELLLLYEWLFLVILFCFLYMLI